MGNHDSGVLDLIASVEMTLELPALSLRGAKERLPLSFRQSRARPVSRSLPPLTQKHCIIKFWDEMLKA